MCSMVTTVVLAVERYLAVTKPVEYHFAVVAAANQVTIRRNFTVDIEKLQALKSCKKLSKIRHLFKKWPKFFLGQFNSMLNIQ
jgi:hypothetical protein